MPLTFRDVAPGMFVVDAIANCPADAPREFRDVAQVLEIYGGNPLVLIPQPLGVDAVMDILTELAKRRACQVGDMGDASLHLAGHARDVLLAALAAHDEVCPNQGECLEVANVLAFLAHCLGATDRHLKALPRLLARYELECRNHGGCDTHRPTA